MFIHHIAAVRCLAFTMAAGWSLWTTGYVAAVDGASNAQAKAAPPSVSPEVLAFLKPAELADGDNELQKKLKERHNAAVALLEERVAEYKKGTREASVVFEAARMVADAKLELAETAEARVAALELTLQVAKLFENRLQEQVDKGFGSKGDLARSRIARLSIEIELLKAKSK